MDEITVLRIETEDGSGPFSHPLFADAMNEAMGDPNMDWHDELPSSLDMFPGAPDTMVCGAETARGIIRWFPIAMRDALAEYRFGVSIYRVDRKAVLHADGAMQVMFDPARATREHRPFPLRRERDHRRMKRREALALAGWGICPAPEPDLTV